MTTTYNQYVLSTVRAAYTGGEPTRLAVGDCWRENLAEAESAFRAAYPDAMADETAEIMMIHDGTAAEAKREAAERLAKETGLPVRYSRHGGISVSRGVLVRTGLDATPEAVRQAWEAMGASVWNKPDTARGSTGGSWWDEEG